MESIVRLLNGPAERHAQLHDSTDALACEPCPASLSCI